MSAFGFPPPNDPGLQPPYVSRYITPNGVTDGTAINNAITALGGNGSLLLAPGTFILDTPIIMPVGSTGFKLWGAGRGVTILQPTAAAARAIGFPHTADNDTYQNLTIEDFSIDASRLSAAPGANQTVIGTQINGNANLRMNADRVSLRRIRITGTPSTTAAGNVYTTISLISGQYSTTVAAGSNGVDVSTFAGAGILNVAATTGFAVSGNMVVRTSTGKATLSYTSLTGTTFAGVALVSGSGVLNTGFAVMEGTQNNLTNILLEDIDMVGGNYGAAIMGSSTGTGVAVNVFLDQIVWKRVRWNSNLTPTGAANFGGNQIGGGGFGGTYIVDNSHFVGGMDVNLEFDAPQFAVCSNSTATDARNYSFLSRNFNTPQNIDGQRVIYSNCQAKVLNVPIAASGFGNVAGFALSAPTLNAGFGEMVLSNCSYYCATAQFGQLGSALVMPQGALAQKLIIDGTFTASYPNLNTTPGGVTPGAAVDLRPGSTSFELEGGDIRLVFGGTGNANVRLRGVSLSPQTGCVMRVDLGDIGIDNNVSGLGNGTVAGLLLGLGGAAGGILRGRIRRVGWDTYSSSDVTPTLISPVASTTMAIDGLLTINEVDLRKDPAAAPRIIGGTPDQINRAAIQVRSANLPTYPIPSAAISANYFATANWTTATANQYIGGLPAEIHFAIGTGAGITTIDSSKDGVLWENVYTQASGAMAQSVLVPVENGDYIRVTFATTQPTARVRFRRSQ